MTGPGPPPRDERTCAICQRHHTADELAGATAHAWTPLHAGWRCPTCTREYTRRIDQMARAFVATHPSGAWVAINEHHQHYGCTICDVIARATELVLSAPERPPGAGA